MQNVPELGPPAAPAPLGGVVGRVVYDQLEVMVAGRPSVFQRWKAVGKRTGAEVGAGL